MTIIGEKNIKELIGEVVSDKMHPIYKKRFVVRKKYYAHNAENQAKLGDTVKIRLVKPISKLKKWNIVEVL